MKTSKRHRSFSADDTRRIGAELAREILSSKPKAKATIVALRGDLGAGKTTFTQGFSKGLGVRRRAASPTFVICRRYAIAHPLVKNLYHVDAYRLKKAKDILDLGFDEVLRDPRNIVLIEWPEKISALIPRSAARIDFSHGKQENERSIRIRK